MPDESFLTKEKLILRRPNLMDKMAILEMIKEFVSFDEKGHAIGFLHLRLSLNEFLRQFGGHIGYSIRPSVRNKGYAKEQLR